MAKGNALNDSAMAVDLGQALIESHLSDFERQEDCDIFFNVDGKTIGAHKMVLKIRGRGLLEFGSRQVEDRNRIEIESMEFDLFKMLLRFNYTGHMLLTESNIFSLLHAAKRFNLTHLQELCVEHISRKLSSRNVCQFMEEAINFNCQALQRKCQEMFSRNTVQIVRHYSFLQLSQPALSTFLDTEEIVLLEMPLFLRVKNWMTVKCKERNLDVNGANMREVIGDAIFKIRFPTMTASDFGNHAASKEGLLTDTEVASVFRMMTMLNNSAVNCPFSARHRCGKSYIQTLLPDAKLVCEKTRLHCPTVQDMNLHKSTIRTLLGQMAFGQHHLNTPAIQHILQCCADLANTWCRPVQSNPGNQRHWAEVYDDYCTLLDAMETESLSDIGLKFQALRRKLYLLYPL